MSAWGYGWQDSDQAADLVDEFSSKVVEGSQRILDRVLAESSSTEDVAEDIQYRVRPRAMLTLAVLEDAGLVGDEVGAAAYLTDAASAMHEHLLGDYADSTNDPEAYRAAVQRDISALTTWAQQVQAEDDEETPQPVGEDWAVAAVLALPGQGELLMPLEGSAPWIAGVTQSTNGVTVVLLAEDYRTDRRQAQRLAEALALAWGWQVSAVGTGQGWVVAIRQRMVPLLNFLMRTS